MATPIPKNHASFTIPEILEATGGSVLTGEGSGVEVVTGVSTDTRALDPGAAFVAIRGATFDGHDHLKAAQAAGTAVAIVDQDVLPPAGLVTIRVGSTVEALGLLARAHVRRWRALGGERRVIAITGSAGKTTTRVALTALLERLRPSEVHATQGNLNNLIGAPMILLGLLPEHRYAVVEVATNTRGEIEALAAIAEPDMGIVTLIDAAHTEKLGSLEGVATEKGALFQALPAWGHAIGNIDSELVARELSRARADHKLAYGFTEGADARVVSRELAGLTLSHLTVVRRDPGGTERRLDVTTPLLGEAGALACAGAILAAESALGSPISGAEASVAFATADVGAGAGRLVPVTLADGLLLIDDSYNANPASSAASIRAASEIARAHKRRLVLVLGEMRELGAETVRGHEQVGDAAGASGAEEVIAVRGEAIRIAERAAMAGVPATFAEDAAEASEAALRIAVAGDVVLVKGSRAVATERVARALIEAHGGVAKGGALEALSGKVSE
ncbi:MAG TPA: UDP-N-acetylmuramoyl-tripeptide--D-alanyl-D-alanine ligase [Polyangiaceae bacterium]|nr:UDP-N-acetylmuramoyl-tripeptide--D-alanyl-D-alanine ligase [Polyangiaceae bacterium]